MYNAIYPTKFPVSNTTDYIITYTAVARENTCPWIPLEISLVATIEKNRNRSIEKTIGCSPYSSSRKG
jgi:hypothetical protein